METVVKKLNMLEFNQVKNGYQAQFNDYDTFTKVYNTLENITTINKNSPQSYLNETECSIEFDGEDFVVMLIGNLDIDDYTITIEQG